MTEFSTLPFGQLYKVPSKNGLMAPSSVRGAGVPLINMRELFAFSRIQDQEMELAPLPEKKPESWLVESGDLLFARQSLVASGAGKCVLVKDSKLPRTFESHIIRVRLNRDITNPEFYFYFFNSSAGRKSIGSIVEQVAAAGIRSTDLAKLEVPVPPLHLQNSIAETLGALDDKIESNRELISIISKLISATIDEEVARDYKLVPIASLARFVNGGAYTKAATGRGRMVLRIAELNKGPGSSTVYNELEVPEDRLARPGDILMSWSGSLGVYRWALDEAIVNQHIFKVIPNNFPAWLVFNRLEAVMPIFKGHAADKATTMGHIQRGHLETTQTVIPTSEGVANLEKKLEPLWQRLLIAEREIIITETLRDTLLPELLSGKRRVFEATN